ncbi:MAG: hypothetical protein LBT95_03940 [Treponema sp.]|jgi:hypothetical protein|nr:hypothetical protein [Treponema sp.]
MSSPLGSKYFWFIYIFFIFAGVFSFLPSLAALEVDTAELEQNQAPVVFLNYAGPYARIDTLEQIRNIGYFLGTAARDGALRPGQTGRYFVIRSLSAPEGDKLDADVFGLGVDAGVDHIRNLRLIIQGYLEGTYAYSPEDAKLLSGYVTVYNAVYRKDWNYFAGRYKTPVMANLSREKAGLSMRFDEWPGQTLMAIPLRLADPGSLSAVDTTPLSDSRVLEEMRKEEDRNIDQRKAMVDLKEREAAEAEQRAALQREAIAQEEEKIAQERSDLKAEQDNIAQERQQIREEAAAGKLTPRETAEAAKQLDAREAAAAEQEKELEKREEALEEQREEAEKAEELAEQKTAEAQEDREEIARDQQELITGEAEEGGRAAATGGQSATASLQIEGIIGIRLAASSSSLGQMVRVHPVTGTEIKRSALNTINARTVTILEGKIIAIAGEDRGNGAIRLVEIDPATLEMNKQGADDIHQGSLIWASGNEFYAITSSGGNLYLGRFNINLDRQALSSVQVHPYAAVNFQGDFVSTQRADGSALLLNIRDLSERK